MASDTPAPSDAERMQAAFDKWWSQPWVNRSGSWGREDCYLAFAAGWEAAQEETKRRNAEHSAKIRARLESLIGKSLDAPEEPTLRVKLTQDFFDMLAEDYE